MWFLTDTQRQRRAREGVDKGTQILHSCCNTVGPEGAPLCERIGSTSQRREKAWPLGYEVLDTSQ